MDEIAEATTNGIREDAETTHPGELEQGGRIANVATRMYADAVTAGIGDADVEEILEVFIVEGKADYADDVIGLHEGEGIRALGYALKRLQDGKPVGGGAPMPVKVTRQADRKVAEEEAGKRPTVHLLIPTDQIVADIFGQVRARSSGRPTGTHEEAVRSYAETMRRGKELPPILVGRRRPEAPDDEHQVYVLIDGWHRFEAQTRVLGRTSVTCEVTGEADPKVWRWLAVQRNAEHGVRLTTKDHLGVFKTYIEAGRHLARKGRFMVVKSMREMERDLIDHKISRRKIDRWMREHYPDLHEKMKSHMAVEEPKDAETKATEAREWARRRRLIQMQALLDQAVAIYRDADRYGEERKVLAELVKKLPVRMTKGRIKAASLRDYEQELDSGGSGPVAARLDDF